jgi:hypothetical protein
MPKSLDLEDVSILSVPNPLFTWHAYGSIPKMSNLSEAETGQIRDLCWSFLVLEKDSEYLEVDDGSNLGLVATQEDDTSESQLVLGLDSLLV